MADNARGVRRRRRHLPTRTSSPSAGAGRGLLAALAAKRGAGRHRRVARRSSCRAWSRPRRRSSTCGSSRSTATACCRCAPATRAFVTAAAFRRHCRRRSIRHLLAAPSAAPLAAAAAVRARRRAAGRDRADAGRRPRRRCSPAARCARRAADRSRGARRCRIAAVDGAAAAALDALRRRAGSTRYGDERNDPDADVASGLSPYLHFGHVGAHEVVAPGVGRGRLGSVADRDARANGRREGWWGMPPSAEAFLDELITWRELGYDFCLPPRRLRPVRVAARLGAHDARRARRRSAAARSTRRDARARRAPTTRCGTRRRRQLVARGPHPQLPAHAVGQEDPRVVADRRAPRSPR